MKFSNRHASGYLHSFHPADSVTLLQSGPSFFNRLLELIESTQRVLHIQMYILDFEGVGARVEEALHRAAARGVDIYLVADGFGSRMLQQASIDRLLEAGIQFRWFSRISLFRNTTIGRRLHHKVVVADGQTALVGGINIAQKYHGSSDREAWLDFALELNGPVCLNIEKLCAQIEEREYLPKLKDLPVKAAKGSGIPVSIRRNDWLRNKKQVFYSYVAAINRAERSIVLFASYFLPGNRIRKALEQASKRGVDITIVLAGNSDIPLAINATYYLYRWLHRCQIKIYEWNPSVLHAKLAIIDD
ncbi:MAG TPA: phospholipase D-like domain-containing protein, partial [Saprospiraceae bacterium]|nr:phospholipase D-like domain-containing protein [Saprospiraceae bacterium]